MSQQPHHWIDFRCDSDMQTEAMRAHFTGHAYDPHWHDSYLFGVTEQDVQQFHSRRERRPAGGRSLSSDSRLSATLWAGATHLADS